ncbi:DUF3592 domain-containing protein [Chitinophaga sp. YIM B06452]|uniref:DUF3592 domain-containing protein n=1 Tax=Chitinophaga sp. YIM B06452 TaxID=3082158 RepID=UPI0031FF2198
MKYRLFLLTGVILFAISLYKLKQSVDFINRSERAIGTVTSLHEIDGAYSPVFTVKTKDNAQVIYHHASATNPSSWDIGEEAMFLYDPGDPRSVAMMSYFWLFNWAILFMGIAIPLIILGAGYYMIRPVIQMPQKA